MSLNNNRSISNKAPNKYFLEIKENLDENLNEVLESNFINELAYKCALNNDYEGFIKERSNLIIEKAKELCQDFDVDSDSEIEIETEYTQLNLEI